MSRKHCKRWGVDASLRQSGTDKPKQDETRMISPKMKEQVYKSILKEQGQFAIDVKAKELHMQASRLASILKMLKYEHKVEWVGRLWVRGSGRCMSFWRRKK